MGRSPFKGASSHKKLNKFISCRKVLVNEEHALNDFGKKNPLGDNLIEALLKTLTRQRHGKPYFPTREKT